MVSLRFNPLRLIINPDCFGNFNNCPCYFQGRTRESCFLCESCYVEYRRLRDEGKQKVDTFSVSLKSYDYKPIPAQPVNQNLEKVENRILLKELPESLSNNKRKVTIILGEEKGTKYEVMTTPEQIVPDGLEYDTKIYENVSSLELEDN